MRVIKRSGAEVEFDIVKIIAAVTKANAATEEDARMTPVQIQRIAESVELACQGLGRAPTVEEIQDFVEHQIMAHGAFEVAKRYITYRYTRSLVRKSNTTDDKILTLIECTNEESIKKIRERVDALVKETGVELILETTDARESQRIYSRVPDDGPTATTFKDLFIEDIKSTNSYTVVYIGGTLDMRILQKLSEQ